MTDIQYFIKAYYFSRICDRWRVCPQIRVYFSGYSGKPKPKNQNTVTIWKLPISVYSRLPKTMIIR